MTATTFDSVVRAMQARQPFRPFTISLRNGSRLEVTDLAALTLRDGLAIFSPPGGGGQSLFDHDSVSSIIGSGIGASPLPDLGADDCRVVDAGVPPS